MAGSERDYIGTGHPASALLVIEVADTTLVYDLGTKASLYAASGIADYWVVDLTQSQVVLHRDPAKDGTQRFGWRYSTVTRHGRGGDVKPLSAPQHSIQIDELLP